MEKIVQGYNKIVAPFASNKNQMYRPTTLNMLHLSKSERCGRGSSNSKNQLVHCINKVVAHSSAIFELHFVRSISGITTFDLIYDYISSSKLIQENNGDILARAWDLINKRHTRKRIATPDYVQQLFKEFDLGSNGDNDDDDQPPPPQPSRQQPPLQAREEPSQPPSG